MDMYRDGESRYHQDAEFRVMVDFMFNAALEHGYTPGELRQIAFMAALKAERHSTRCTKWGEATTLT